MRQCKQSDVQALEAVIGNLEQITIELSMLRGKLSRLTTDVKNYINEQQEPIDVSTTHGLSADNG
jgi:hypothetical protein